MKKVFVSGCFDLLHGGHLEFFTQAKAYGDYLIVSIASDKTLANYKQRKPSLPIEHKIKLIQALTLVDRVIVSEGDEIGLNFKQDLIQLKPDCLVVTEDDQFEQQKRQLCDSLGIQYIKLPKTFAYQQVSTSSLLSFIKAPSKVPLRIDFAGGWLDVPRYANPTGFIVNCTITPMVSLDSWQYQIGGGLGGSAAYAILTGKNAIESELAQNVGWQDPAIIAETGLCVWQSGDKPKLLIKTNPEWLQGKLALYWTGQTRFSGALTEKPRDYQKIAEASTYAREAVFCQSLETLQEAVAVSYQVQIQEGMSLLPKVPNSVCKYCGAGWGGYAMYLFNKKQSRDQFVQSESSALEIEPFLSDKFLQ